MKKFSEYRTADGGFTGRIFQGPDSSVQQQAAQGLAFIEGEFDELSQRVDLATGEVVSYQPPAPPDDAMRTWQWFDEPKRWIAIPTANAHWEEIRRIRDKLLRESDWRVLRASDGGPEVSPAWQQYRQALRDITTQSDPLNITWPSPPTS